MSDLSETGEENQMREVIIITGPTCVGKTALSLKLAEECGEVKVSSNFREECDVL